MLIDCIYALDIHHTKRFQYLGYCINILFKESILLGNQILDTSYNPWLFMKLLFFVMFYCWCQSLSKFESLPKYSVFQYLLKVTLT